MSTFEETKFTALGDPEKTRDTYPSPTSSLPHDQLVHALLQSGWASTLQNRSKHKLARIKAAQAKRKKARAKRKSK